MAVNFEEPRVPLSMKVPGIGAGPVSRFFISLGLARTPREARIVMVAVACIAFAASVYFFVAGNSSPTPLSQAERDSVQQELDSVVRRR